MVLLNIKFINHPLAILKLFTKDIDRHAINDSIAFELHVVINVY